MDGKNMKFLLFGTGDYYERYKKWFSSEDVLALLDNSSKKQNTTIDGIRVLSPEEGIKLPFDAIVILSFYVKAMKRQLLELGISENKIYHFYDLHQLIYGKELKKTIQYFGNAQELVETDNHMEKKILLLSQDMTLGGPAIALLHAAEILVKHGYKVVYASMIDGPLREKLLSCDIPVIVDVNLQIETMKDADWISSFSLIICNTINFHVFLSERNVNTPVIWWLHDSEFFYDGINPLILKNINKINLKVCSVGPVPKNAIRKWIPDMPIDSLLYGVTDVAENTKRAQAGCRHRISFVTIGYIEERKGQDILIQAIRALPTEVREKAIFYLVGQDSSIMAQRLRTEIEQMPEIVMTGPVDREKINNILDNADMMICPSREDPMPTVAAEAMMHSVPCIVSDVTGTTEYIQDGMDGFVFRSEDVQELADKIEWCIDHYDELCQMSVGARNIYEKYFSMETFEHNLMEIVRDVLMEK